MRATNPAAYAAKSPRMKQIVKLYQLQMSQAQNQNTPLA